MINFIRFELGWVSWWFNSDDDLEWVRLTALPPHEDVEQESSEKRHRFRREMEEYLSGKPVNWSVVPAWRGTLFEQAVWRTLLEQVAWGRLITYGELASLSGYPRASRAVGQAMKHNPWALVVPCHRVVASRGPGGYFGRLDWKRWFLNLEKETPLIAKIS